MVQSYDVAVVGAGPAGSTVAKVVAGEGYRTIVFDRRSTVGIPVQCGELIPSPSEAHSLFPRSKRMPRAVHVPSKFVTNRTQTIRLISPNGSAYEFPFEANIVDRGKYDQYLAHLAEDAGAEFHLSSTVKKSSVRNELNVKTSHTEITTRAKLVVGADGANSVVAQSLGNHFIHNEEDLSPSLQYVMSGADLDESVVDMYFGGKIAPGGYAWVIPKGDGLVNVGFGMRRSIAHDDTPLRKYLKRFAFKTLASSLKDAKILRRVGAIIPVGGPLKKSWSENVLLVGDAAGHVMASNGGGIPTALCGGEIAGDVITDHLNTGVALSEYEVLWKREFGKELDTALSVLRVADTVMPSDEITDICMRLAGVRFLEPLIRCRLPLPVDVASKTMVKILNQFI
ncbi:MAG: geranylgeranyl reductase family protein [Candidatus Thorarchaeota archaeon]|nr:geranylgeranyl reductase family protein [Candidatus Thorarchaeota archaeon]